MHRYPVVTDGAMVGRRPTYKRHEATGWVFPRDGFDWSDFEAACRYRPRADDILVMTYPKSGTTWVQYMLYLLVHDMAPVPAGCRLDSFAPFLEKGGLCLLDSLVKSPRPIKTHLSFDVMPWHPEPRYVCVLRNPKDVCVSLYHHVRGFERYYHFEDGSFDDFFEAFVEGEVDSSDYHDHLLSLWSHRDHDNVLLLKYEDLSERPLQEVRKLVDHVRPCFPSGWMEPDLESLVAAASFDVMKAQPHEQWASSRPDHVPPFIRLGRVGDWRNHLTKEQSKLLEEKFARKTAGSGAEFLWPTEVMVANGD
ncbi:sulfotransferase 1 family member D1-like [Dermacentor variabilis]|uniref:sulfotransferase 1 family member D1-like n=1 Tax=Dermacentor variabilis TaxID=34621 RepID=UPI003F5B89AA